MMAFLGWYAAIGAASALFTLVMARRARKKGWRRVFTLGEIALLALIWPLPWMVYACMLLKGISKWLQGAE